MRTGRVRAPRPRQRGAVAPPPAATRPAQAVQLLTRHLRDDDLVAFARDAVPPALHAQLETAWREGRTRWPLDELPFDDRLPAMLARWPRPMPDAHLQRGFDRQFASAPRCRSSAAAASLGLFGAQYIADQGDYSDDERAALRAADRRPRSRWGGAGAAVRRSAAHAGDRVARRRRARRRPASTADFAHAGMDESLRRIGAFERVVKQVLAGYGLDLDADLAGMRVSLAAADRRHRAGAHALPLRRQRHRHRGVGAAHRRPLVPARTSCATPRPPCAGAGAGHRPLRRASDGRGGPWAIMPADAHPADPALRGAVRHPVAARRPSQRPRAPTVDADARWPAADRRSVADAAPQREGALPPYAPPLVGTPAGQAARAVDRAEHRAAVAAAADRRAPGLLRARGLRPVQRADPRARLPRSRPAVAAAPAAGRSAGPQARLRRAVAAQRRQHAQPRCAARDRTSRRRQCKTAFRIRWRGCSRRIAPIRRWTCSWCRCRSSSAARRTRTAAGSRCCSRRTGRWSAASAACSRSCSTAATRWCGSPRRSALRADRRGRPADPERTVRKLSRVLRTHFNRIRAAIIGPDLSTRRLLIDKVLCVRTR